MRRFGLITSLIAVMPILGVALPAGAQRCLHVDSEPPQAAVTVHGGMGETQGAPADFCNLKPGMKYRLTVARPQYETRTLQFSFREYGQKCKFSGVWEGEVARSAILPGWGHKRLGYPWRTFETWMFLVTDGVKVYQVWKYYDDLKDKNDAVNRLIEQATTQEQLERLGETSQKLAMDANAYREAAILTAALGGWTYVRNVVATYLLTAPPKARTTEGSDFRVKTPRRSRKRAALRSFFFPGLGQRYQGNPGRAFLFRGGVFVLALFTLDRKLRYDLVQNEYDMLRMRFDNADTVEEKEALIPELATTGARVSDLEDAFHAFAIATGALWAANVLETFAGGGGKGRSDRFEFTTSYLHSTLWSGVRISF